MKSSIALKISAAIGLLLAAGLVFSPLLAALFGTGLRGQTLLQAMSDEGKPLGRTAGSAAVAMAVALVLGGPFAVLVERSRPRVRRICWTLGLLVLIVPPYIAGEAAIVLLGPTGKLSRPLAVLLGLGPVSNDPLSIARFAVPDFVFCWGAVGVVMGGCLFPIVALAVGSAYRRTDQRIFESARLARGRSGLWRVGARILISPALGAGLLVFAITLTEFAVPQLLRVRTIGEAVYEQIQEGDVATAAALGLPLLPIVVAAGALGAWLLARSRVASMAGLEGEVPKFENRRGSAGGDLAAGAVTLGAILPGLALPITSLAWLAVTAATPHAATTGRYNVLRASGFLESLRGALDIAFNDALRTVVLAALTASLATVFALALARFSSRVGLGAFLGALGAGLAVPAPIVGLGLIALWDHSGTQAIYQNSIVVMLGWLSRFLPIAIFLIQGALARVPRELEYAAALAGRGPFGRMAAVVIPGTAPGLLAAWLAIYVLSATEFSTTVLVSPPGKSLLAPSVVNLMRRGQDPEIAACQFLLLIVVALPLAPLAIALIARRQKPKPDSPEVSA